MGTLLFVCSEHPALVQRQHQARVSYAAEAYSRRQRNRTRTLGAAHLARLRDNGVVISALTANSAIETIRGPLEPRENGFAHPPSEVGSLVPFPLSQCPRESSPCVVSYPLPEMVWDERVTFCVHSGDDATSKSLLKTGVCNSPLVFLLWATLLQEQDMHLIDIGASVGTLTAVAGKLGRQVVALESLKANADVLCKTVISNNLTSQVIILQNAVSNPKSTFTAVASKSNMAAVLWVPVNEAVSKTGISSRVSSVSMDDLLSVIQFKKAFLSINIAQSDHLRSTLQSASGIFRKVHILVIAMELRTPSPRSPKQVSTEDVELVFEVLTRRGYRPYQMGGRKLEERAIASWRGSIYWLQKDYRFQVDPWSLYKL